MTIDDIFRHDTEPLLAEAKTFPFLGARCGTGPKFSYRVIAVNRERLIVGVARNSTSPQPGECVDLHLPFHLPPAFANRAEVREETPAGQETQCACVFREQHASLRYPIWIEVDTGEISFVPDRARIGGHGAMVRRLAEDASYFARGAAIYFSHLSPYFTRLSMHPALDTVRLNGDFAGHARADLEGHARRFERFITQPDEGCLELLLNGDASVVARNAATAGLHVGLLAGQFTGGAAKQYLHAITLLTQQLLSTSNALALLRLHLSGQPIA